MFWIILFLSVLALNAWLFYTLAGSQRSFQSSDTDTTTLEDVFIAVISVTIVTSWLGLVLAEMGVFSLLALSGLLIVVALGLMGWLWRRRVHFRRPIALRLDRYDVLALFLALLVAILYSRPAEWVVGGEDPGVYVNTGVNIARTGAILIHDQTLDDLDPNLAEVLLFSRSNQPEMDGGMAPGFYLSDLDKGVVVPQFFHIFPVWIASLYLVGGIKLALFATPLFGWLSVLALYFLGRRLIHPGAGLLAMALLAVNISQLWFARNAFADIVTQFYLLSGFWASALWIERAGRDHPATMQAAILSAACFGISHLVKADMFITPVVVLGFVAYSWLMGIARRSHACFLAIYLLLVVHAAWHGYFFSRPYVADLSRLFADYVRLGKMGLLAAVPLLLLVAWQRSRVARLVLSLSRYQEALKRIFVLFILVLSLYAYFVRPLRANLGAMDEQDLAAQGTVANWFSPLATEPEVIKVRTFIEEGIVRVGWYLTPLGIWLGIAGFLYWVTSELKLKSAPLLGGAFLSAVLLFYRGALVSHYFWAFKRFVPLVVPTFILFIAFLLRQLWPDDRSHWQKTILPLVLACFLLTSYIWGSLMFWEHVEWGGAVKNVEALASRLPEDGVLLFDARQQEIERRISLPLNYIYGRDIYLIGERQQTDPRLRQVIAAWHEQGRPVYWLASSCNPLQDYHPFFQVSDERITFRRVFNAHDKLPDRIHIWSPRLCIYHITGTDTEHSQHLNITLDNQINLVGYEVDTTQVAPGDEIHLNLYWQAQQALENDYTVFTHVLGEGLIWGQKDSQPAQGSRPTSGWGVGEVIRDSVAIPIQPDTPPGTYQLQVGMYDLATLERLPVLDDTDEPIDDRIILESIQVTAPGTDETTK